MRRLIFSLNTMADRLVDSADNWADGLSDWRTSFRWWLHEVPDRTARWIAWRLPKRLVMWSTYRVGANATQGRYANTEVPSLTFMDAMHRWTKD